MSGFAFQVACLRLVANEPLFGIYAVLKFIKFTTRTVQVVLLRVRIMKFSDATQLGVDMGYSSIITGISLSKASKGHNRFSGSFGYLSTSTRQLKPIFT